MASLALILQKTELFADLSPETIQREIIPHGHFQEYQKGQFLIAPQQKVEKFGILLSGKVHILHIFADGTQCKCHWLSDYGRGPDESETRLIYRL